MAITQSRILSLLDETRIVEEQIERHKLELQTLINLANLGEIDAGGLTLRLQMILDTGALRLTLNNHYAERAHFRRFAKRNDRERARQQQGRMEDIITKKVRKIKSPLEQTPKATPMPAMHEDGLDLSPPPLEAPLPEPAMPDERVAALEEAGWEFMQTGPNEGQWLLWDEDKIVGREGDSKWKAALGQLPQTKSGSD